MIMLITIIAAGFFNQYLAKDYSRVNNDSTDFVSGKIVEITSSNLEYDQDLKINLGKQVVVVEILEGKSAGKRVEIDNYLTAAHNVEVAIGSKVIISADEPDGITANCIFRLLTSINEYYLCCFINDCYINVVKWCF